MAMIMPVVALASVALLGLGPAAADAGDGQGAGTSVAADHAVPATPGQHPRPGKHPKGREVAVVPTSGTAVANCIPFGNNTDFGFTGFVYRDVPAFHLRPGDPISFDLGARNDRPVQRDIYLAAATRNPGPAEGGVDTLSQDVRAREWRQVVSESQVPDNAVGDDVVGNYELTYRAESAFRFRGGGLVVGFAPSPPAEEADEGCDRVVPGTTSSDGSGQFYARFCYQPFLTLGPLDEAGECRGTGVGLAGIVIRSSGRVPPDGRH